MVRKRGSRNGAVGRIALILPWAVLALFSLVLVPGPADEGAATAASATLRIAEVVTHPIQDWNENGLVSVTDEYVVLRNDGTTSIDLSGWSLEMQDSTPETLALGGTLLPGAVQVVLNPPGQMNNDVTLQILDADGLVIDAATLGTNGLPLGRGDGAQDEAVHLVGPWAGQRGPGTLGRGLQEIAVLRVAPATFLALGDTVLPPRFSPSWFAAETAIAVEVLAAAPDVVPTHLSVAGTLHPLSAVPAHPGWWRTDPLALDAALGEIILSVHSPTGAVDAFPAGGAIVLHHDTAPPRVVPVSGASSVFAVADGAGRVHALPRLEPGASGVVHTAVQHVGVEGVVAAEGCMPLERPSSLCVVSGPGATLRIDVLSGAGAWSNTTFPVAVWDSTPQVPDIRFLPGPPPRLAWNATDRIHSEVAVEATRGADGDAFLVAVLDGDPLAASDTAWLPGERPKYRLRVTDLAGNTAVGAWSPLDLATVPVQLAWDADAAAAHLAASGAANITIVADRPLATPPKLVLDVQTPAPLSLEGAAEPTDDPLVYRVRLNATTPLVEVEGSWSITGASGVDGAPGAGLAASVRWDVAAPRVEAPDAPQAWVNSSSVAFTLRARDGLDPAPAIVLAALPEGTTVNGTGALRQVRVSGDGEHEVSGNATDDAGNTAPFSFIVRIDTEPPIVTEPVHPETWSATHPIDVHVDDDASGVDHASARAWVRNATGMLEATVATGNGTSVRLIPPGGAQLAGPFEVYFAVRDRAGNGFEGLLGASIEIAATASPAEAGAPDPRRPAPSFLGPGWGPGGTGPASPPAAPARDANGTAPAARNDAPWAAVTSMTGTGDGSPSYAWLLVGLAGSVGLGTVVHRVQRGRRRAAAVADAVPPSGDTPAADPAASSLEADATARVDDVGPSIEWSYPAEPAQVPAFVGPAAWAGHPEGSSFTLCVVCALP